MKRYNTSQIVSVEVRDKSPHPHIEYVEKEFRLFSKSLNNVFVSHKGISILEKVMTWQEMDFKIFTLDKTNGKTIVYWKPRVIITFSNREELSIYYDKISDAKLYADEVMEFKTISTP